MGSIPTQGYLNNNNLQAELPSHLNEQSIDWLDFKSYLLKTCKRNTVKVRLCYAKRYASVLWSVSPDQLLVQLSPQNRLNVMKSLTALSKYTGQYDTWQQMRKQYNLKWSTGRESLDAFERFFNPNLTLDSMLSKVRQMMQVLPKPMSEVIRFAVLTGLRPSEACESVRLLNCLPVNNFSSSGKFANCLSVDKSVTVHRYYNPEQQCLEHFRFPEIFLRATKKAYLSYITLDNLQPIANLGSKTPTWNSIRLTCRRRHINMDMRLTRKIFASWLRQSGIQSEAVDMLQGRVSPSILTRHYLVPDSSLRQKVLDATEQLQIEVKV